MPSTLVKINEEAFDKGQSQGPLMHTGRGGCLREAGLVLLYGEKKAYPETKPDDFNLVGNDSHGTGAP